MFTVSLCIRRLLVLRFGACVSGIMRSQPMAGRSHVDVEQPRIRNSTALANLGTALRKRDFPTKSACVGGLKRWDEGR